ncbi:MAG: hypothetical protein GX047_09730 [Firmicutes bacterium]|nr:hypothetical protein [Bacillota bacterium]
MNRPRKRAARLISIASLVLMALMVSGGQTGKAEGLPITDPALLRAIQNSGDNPEDITRLYASHVVSLEGIESLNPLRPYAFTAATPQTYHHCSSCLILLSWSWHTPRLPLT